MAGFDARAFQDFSTCTACRHQNRTVTTQWTIGAEQSLAGCAEVVVGAKHNYPIVTASRQFTFTMRVSEKSLYEYPWYVRLFFWRQKRKYGQILRPALLWGKVPKLFMAVATLYGVLDRRSSPLNPVLRALVTVRVSQINWCRFCVDINSATLVKRSQTPEKLEALEDWRRSDVYDAREKVALEYAEAITFTDQRVSDELFTRLQDVFDDNSIVELTALIAFQNLSSKFNSALDVPAQGFCNIASFVEKLDTEC